MSKILLLVACLVAIATAAAPNICVGTTWVTTEGGACNVADNSLYCASELTCNKWTSTCEFPGVKNKTCSVDSDCEQSLNLESLICVGNKCTRDSKVLGDSCTTNRECSSGKCDSDGTCTSLKEGDSCTNGCGNPIQLYCRNGKCEKPATEGAPCGTLSAGGKTVCAGNLVCVNSSIAGTAFGEYAGTCTPYVGAGETCSESYSMVSNVWAAPRCDSRQGTLVCSLGKCRKPTQSKLGEECTLSTDRPCQVGLICVAGTCQDPSSVPCNTTNNPCWPTFCTCGADLTISGRCSDKVVSVPSCIDEYTKYSICLSQGAGSAEMAGLCARDYRKYRCCLKKSTPGYIAAPDLTDAFCNAGAILKGGFAIVIAVVTALVLML